MITVWKRKEDSSRDTQKPTMKRQKIHGTSTKCQSKRSIYIKFREIHFDKTLIYLTVCSSKFIRTKMFATLQCGQHVSFNAGFSGNPSGWLTFRHTYATYI